MDYETWTDLYQNQSVDWFNFNNKAKIGTISLDYKGNFFMKNKDITMDLSLDTIEEVDSFVANLKEYIQNYNNSYYSSNHLYLLNVYPKDELLDYATGFYLSVLLLPILILEFVYASHKYIILSNQDFYFTLFYICALQNFTLVVK